MEENAARNIMTSVVDYLNLSQLNTKDMHRWLFKQMVKNGCDCKPKEDITSETAKRDHWASIDFVFTRMCAIPVSRFRPWMLPKSIKGVEVKVQPCFGGKYDFIVEPGINGVVFFLRLAASSTNMTRGGQCELCYRLFFATRTGVKYCCDSCRVMACEIRNGKRNWTDNLYFRNSLKKREKAILQEAKNER